MVCLQDTGHWTLGTGHWTLDSGVSSANGCSAWTHGSAKKESACATNFSCFCPPSLPSPSLPCFSLSTSLLPEAPPLSHPYLLPRSSLLPCQPPGTSDKCRHCCCHRGRERGIHRMCRANYFGGSQLEPSVSSVQCGVPTPAAPPAVGGPPNGWGNSRDLRCHVAQEEQGVAEDPQAH